MLTARADQGAPSRLRELPFVLMPSMVEACGDANLALILERGAAWGSESFTQAEVARATRLPLPVVSQALALGVALGFVRQSTTLDLFFIVWADR